MPLWGRPSGGRLGRKGQKRLAGPQSWDERRFEEIEDSDDGFHGVELDLGLSQKRHVSDELRFTGVELSTSKARRRKGNAYDEDSDSSYHDDEDDEDEEDDSSDGQDQKMQIMLREKEDLLVERALERISRAQMLGKTDVKLSQAEIDALERAKRIQKPSGARKTSKGERGASVRPKAGERKRSKSDKPSASTPPLKAIEPRRKTKISLREETQPSYPAMIGPDSSHAAGAVMFAPPGYHALPLQRPKSSSSKPGSRKASSQSLRQPQPHTPPLPQYQHPYHAGRYFSNPDPAYAGRPLSNPFRPDPSDPNWEPRARSTSNLIPYPIDQPPYALYQPPPPPPPPPPQFDPRDPRFIYPPGPRIASGPPDMYPSPPMPGYRHAQDELYLYSPATPGMGTTAGNDEDEGEDGYDEDGGVEVNVVEQDGGSYGIRTRSGAAGVSGGRGGGGGGGGGGGEGGVTRRGKRGK